MSVKDNIEILFENSLNCDLTFKIIIIGEAGVGKSCLTLRITKNNFIEKYNPTIGFENHSLYFKKNEKIFKFDIWDTCGQETYRSLIKSYYQNTSLAILVYSIDDENSYNKLNMWLNDLKSFCDEKIKIFLVGNKIDLEDKRKISTEVGYKYYQKNNLNKFYEVSAKNGDNIKELFIEGAIILYNEYYKNNEEKIKKSNKDNDVLIIEDNNKVFQTCNNSCC